MKKKIIFIFMIILPLSLLAQKDKNEQLLLATEDNKDKKVLDLLRAGADPNTKNAYEVTPIMYAAENGNQYICKILIDYGADIDAKPEYGAPPLVTAAQFNHSEIVNLFMLNGANPDIVDDYDNTALIYAIAYGHAKIADMLLYYGANPNKACNNVYPISISSYYNDTLLTNILIEKKTDINARSKSNYTPLMIAAEKGNLPIVKILVNNGADLNYKNSDGYTAIALASTKGNNEIVDFLAKNKADVNAKNKSKLSPIMLAQIYGKYNVKKTLKQYGAQKSLRPIFNSFSINFNQYWNFSDYMLSMDVGIHDLNYKFNFYMGFASRPFGKRIWYQEREHFYLQLREKRTMFYFSLNKSIQFYQDYQINYGMYLGYKGAYTYGKYEATLKRVESMYMHIPTIGFYWERNYFGFKAGYEYTDFNVIKSAPHLILTSIYIKINPSKISKSNWELPDY